MEKENSMETIVAIFSEKIDQLINKVNQIVTKLDSNDAKMQEIEKEILLLNEKDKSQQKELDEQKSIAKSNKSWILGIVSGIVVAVIGGLIRYFLKV